MTLRTQAIAEAAQRDAKRQRTAPDAAAAPVYAQGGYAPYAQPPYSAYPPYSAPYGAPQYAPPGYAPGYATGYGAPGYASPPVYAPANPPDYGSNPPPPGYANQPPPGYSHAPPVAPPRQPPPRPEAPGMGALQQQMMGDRRPPPQQPQYYAQAAYPQPYVHAPPAPYSQPLFANPRYPSMAQNAPAPPMQPPGAPPDMPFKPGHVNVGTTPTQAFQSYVPISAKAQYDAARDFMANEAMKKMGRKGIAKRVPTWLESSELE